MRLALSKKSSLSFEENIHHRMFNQDNGLVNLELLARMKNFEKTKKIMGGRMKGAEPNKGLRHRPFLV